jgi:hypothetical protein
MYTVPFLLLLGRRLLLLLLLLLLVMVLVILVGLMLFPSWEVTQQLLKDLLHIRCTPFRKQHPTFMPLLPLLLLLLVVVVVVSVVVVLVVPIMLPFLSPTQCSPTLAPLHHCTPTT